MISRRQSLKLFGGLAASCIVPRGLSAKQPPNVVLIMADDQGQWALGCYGNDEIVTPNIDRLAATGSRFTRSFCATPVCSPTRATLLTGLLPCQHGIHDWINEENEGDRARSLVKRFTLITDILARQGYSCGLSGKWHLGDNVTPFRNHDFWFALPTGGSQYQNARVSFNGEVYQSKGYLTERITDRAVQFIREKKDGPFFLNVEYNAPHGPWKSHPQRLVDLYKDCPFKTIPKEPRHPWASALLQHLGNRNTLEQYFAAVSGIDEGVGTIVDTLDEVGIRDNTIIVYLSDHGFQCGHNGLFGKGNCSTPRNMFEESMLVPHIVNAPGIFPEARVFDEMVSFYDFMPTMLELAGVEKPAGRYAGRSYAPLLQGQTVDWDNTVYGEYGRARMIHTDEWKLIHRADGGPDEFYNMKDDPKEDHNLIDDPSVRSEMVKLRKQMIEWFYRYAEGDADPVGIDRILPGK